MTAILLPYFTLHLHVIRLQQWQNYGTVEKT